MGTAIFVYAQTHGGRFPLAYWDGHGDPPSNKNGATDWGWLILPYLKKGSTGTYNDQDPTGIWTLYKDKDTISGNAPQFSWYNSEKVQTYAVHPHLFRFAPLPVNPSTLDYNHGATSSLGSADDGKKPFKLTQVRRSAEIIMVADAVQIGDELGPNTWAADTTLWMIQSGSTSYCHNWASLKDCETQFPKGPDAGFNKDYMNIGSMQYDGDPTTGTAINIRFRHLKNTVANAVFVDGHVESFHWKRPGLGGSDLQFKNFILDDLRKQDMIYGP
jgi:prepilin-type processing-associated H-X9-DG protein